MNLTITPNLYNRTQYKQCSAQKSKSVNFGNELSPFRTLTREENVLYKEIARESKEAFRNAKNLIVENVTDEFSEPIYKIQSKTNPEIIGYCHTSSFAKPMLMVKAGTKSHIIHYAQNENINNVSKTASAEWLTNALSILAPKY